MTVLLVTIIIKLDFSLPQGAAALEAAQKVRIVVFDKTGTLTQGKPAVTSHKIFSSSHSEVEILKLAAAAEASSEHPIAQAILEHSYASTRWPHSAGKNDTDSKDALDCELPLMLHPHNSSTGHRKQYQLVAFAFHLITVEAWSLLTPLDFP